MNAPTPRTPLHPSVTLERVTAAVEDDDYTGFCRACGAERDNTEPDARQYKCDACGAPAVYGAEELLIELA